MILKKPAVKVTQGDLTIYATSLLVKDLMISKFYQIDKLDASNATAGFQRVLDKTRTKRLADYILDAWKDKDAFLPTSIFLATNKDVAFDSEKNEITFEVEKVCPFNVVDGQHRVEGLIEAARQNPEIENFELVANIAVLLDDVTQMCHFLIVNTTQKAVDRAVEQQIISRLTGMVNIEDIPTLPKWIQRQVMKGEDKEALVNANYLNTDFDSPWYQKIRMANEDRDDLNTINQKSFVQSTKSYILSSNNPLAAETDIDRRNKILKNYWKAIDQLLVRDDSVNQSVVYKTIGLELFNIISATVFMKLYNERNFTVDRIKELLQHGFSHLPNEHLSVQTPDWWESGGGASNINKAAVRHIATELNKAMNVQQSTGNIQL
ncbi:MAG: DGQHR domain-containing protein [Ferruginibacter sp.]